jgi:hypothetical protein
MRAFGTIDRMRLAVGGLAFAVFAPLAYLVQRLVDHARFGSVDPLAMLRQLEVAYYWRSATACYWGGLATIVAMWLFDPRSRAGGRTPLWLGAAAIAVALALVVLGWRFP